MALSLRLGMNGVCYASKKTRYEFFATRDHLCAVYQFLEAEAES